MAPRLETSIVKRASAITLHQEGYNTREISEKTCVHQRTVSRIIAHYKETGDIEFKKRSGRPRKTELSDDVYLHTLSKRNRRLTAAQLQAAMNETLIRPICKTTIKNRLKEVGLRGCIAIRKPLLRAANKKKRLAWARLYKNWTYRDWAKVLWTDESKFVVFGSNRKVYVRRKPGEQLLEDCVVSTVKHGGSSVMVWGCFGGEKVDDIVKVDGRMDRFHYKAILEEHAIPSGLRILGRGFIFQQDNDPKHTSKLCKEFLEVQYRRRKLYIMSWPPQSPDLNPIELLWDHLDREVRKTCPTSQRDLWEKLQATWVEIGGQTLRKLLHRMPKLCAAVIKNKGGHIIESAI